MSPTTHGPPAGPARAPLLGRRVVTAAALLSAAAGLAAQTLVLPIQALDPEGVAVPGVRFTYGGAETPDTTDAGVTELRVPLKAGEDVPPGTAVELGLPASVGRTWFLIDDTVHVPATGEPPAEVVLMSRAAFRRLAAEVRDAPPGTADELSETRRRQAVAEYAAGYGLDETELERAIAAFRESAEDPMDEGVAAFVSREWARAEPLFRQALADAEERREEAEEDIAESARYLGSTLYEQGRYREAVAAFRKALAVRGQLRAEPSRCRHQPQQPGAAASGHEPARGGRAADAPGAFDLRSEPRRRASPYADRARQPGGAPSSHRRPTTARLRRLTRDRDAPRVRSCR